MLIDTPQITWHGGEAGKNAPVLSIDFHPLPIPRKGTPVDGDTSDGVAFLLATAGTDGEVRLWLVNRPNEEEEKSWDKPDVSRGLHAFVVSLGGHQRGVNVVRFSPNGLSLASASDGGTIVIWSVTNIEVWGNLQSDRETKKVILRGAQEDIYDLTWSPDCRYIACGSIDRRAHVWEVATKRSAATLEDHTNYVQGTAWDPLCKYMATQSSDRSCRIYQLGDGSIKGGGSCGGGGGGLGPLTVKGCNIVKTMAVTSSIEGNATTGVGVGAMIDEQRQSTTGKHASEGEEGSPICGKGLGSVSNIKDGTKAGVGGTMAGGETKKKCELGAETCPSARPDEEGVEAESGIVAPPIPLENVSLPSGRVDKEKAQGTKAAPRSNMFVDETVASFFRRLTWSPDGAFLITPTAQYRDHETGKTLFCTYLFLRGRFLRCCPRLFRLKGAPSSCSPSPSPSKMSRNGEEEQQGAGGKGNANETTGGGGSGSCSECEGGGDSWDESSPLCDLPYRTVFAVVTLDTVVVYDTENSYPLTIATGLHYAGLTDACWSSDGCTLMVSSTDGYVSVVHFKEGELGETIKEEDVPLQTKQLHPVIYSYSQEAEAEGKRGGGKGDVIANGPDTKPVASAELRISVVSPCDQTSTPNIVQSPRKVAEDRGGSITGADAESDNLGKVACAGEEGGVRGSTTTTGAVGCDVRNEFRVTASKVVKAVPVATVPRPAKRKIAPTLVSPLARGAPLPSGPAVASSVPQPQQPQHISQASSCVDASVGVMVVTHQASTPLPGTAAAMVAPSLGTTNAVGESAKKRRITPTLVTTVLAPTDSLMSVIPASAAQRGGTDSTTNTGIGVSSSRKCVSGGGATSGPFLATETVGTGEGGAGAHTAAAAMTQVSTATPTAPNKKKRMAPTLVSPF